MHIQKLEASEDLNPQETSEWLEALDQVIEEGGLTGLPICFTGLEDRATDLASAPRAKLATPYVNTIPAKKKCLSRRPAMERHNQKSFAGMRRPWSCGPISTIPTSAATFRPTHRLRP